MPRGHEGHLQRHREGTRIRELRRWHGARAPATQEHVEQAFRMSKTDLKTRPIFHYTHDAIRAHVLLCFVALMIGKFLEIKTGLSLKRARDILWDVQEAHIEDSLTGKRMILQGNLETFKASNLSQIDLSH